jgi:deoxyadenosine/deoxycytidine kinase
MASPIIITLDGNIGAGKSTLLEAIRRSIPTVTVIPEPVADWLTLKNAEGESLLSLFYKDTKRWSYTFQNCAILTRLLETQKIIKNWTPAKSPIIITERSVLTDRYVFADMLHKQGKMDDLEWALYLKWYDNYAAELPIKGILHLTTNAKLSQDRIGMRGRVGEESIPLDYLEDLEAQHNAWISKSPLPSLRINTDDGIESAVEKIQEWLSTQFKSAEQSPRHN